MTDTKLYELINNFFQVFSDSINSTLSKNLDADICTNIQFTTLSSSKARDVENLKADNVIYRLDYTTGNRQGALVVLIPEELIAVISDILTGGSGNEAYKGSLSEIETNSSLKILEKIFKSIESDFKKNYQHDLVFSSNPVLLLKEMPDYNINSEDSFFDLLVNNTLSLSEDKKYNISFLLPAHVVEKLMDDLGLSRSNSTLKRPDISSLDVNCLSDIKINITAELGRTRVPIKYALELVRGSLVELDTLNNSDIKVFANGVEFAHAQVVAVEDNFGLKITKIISPEERMEYI